MKRDRSTFLMEWLVSETRKPLVIRGARQVGKTWLIRDLAHSQQKRLIELNFEKQPSLESLFTSNDVQEILLHMAATFGGKVDPFNSVLFLDEIQAVPHLLGKLRWFAEDLPQLPVIAAGSLLDFALAELAFSMPVGRINYLYLEPLSFEEFLDATGHASLRAYLQKYEMTRQIPQAIHDQLMKSVKEYVIVGGMPAAVSSWVLEKNPDSLHQMHLDLLTSYREDFAKYSGRLITNRLEEVLGSIPLQLGKKFVYKHVNPDIQAAPLKQAFDLLTKARVSHRISATYANGLPLGAEVDERSFKALLLDCGLCSTSLGLSIYQLTNLSELSMVNKGGIAEQLTGQILRTITAPYAPPAVYYWQREKKNSEAEIDYLIQHEDQIIPIEVKAGLAGSLKSLHQFMKEKKKTLAVRVNSDLPSLTPVQVKDSFGSSITYTLLSLPFYLLGQLHRLIATSKMQSPPY